jgi:molybdate transport system ATP-binding protein
VLSVELDDDELGIHVSLKVPTATCVAVTGPSGAGKTTILRAIAGLRPGATVTCDGEEWTRLPPEKRPVGFVFQDHALFPHLTARQNVAYGSSPARADELLARFGLEHRTGAKPRTLSGGERQRVALARALAREPKVLLLDEPLSALDVRTKASATRALASALATAGVPAILVTHDFTEAATFADRVAVLDHGRIVQEGTAQELTARPGSAFVADLTGAVVLTGTAHPQPDGLTRVDLDGGGTLLSVDVAAGPVAATVHPWEISLGEAAEGSARNRLDATVETISSVGGRVRIGLDAGQPLVAEVTAPAVEALQLKPGSRVTASFKAAATRLVAR